MNTDSWQQVPMSADDLAGDVIFVNWSLHFLPGACHGKPDRRCPMSQYMLNPMNIGVTIALAILPPLMATLLLPKSPDLYQPLDEEAIAAIEKESLNLKGRPEHPTVGEFLNYSPVLAWALGILGFTYIGYAFYTKGLNALDFNMLNAVFLFGGILLYGNIANYMVAFKDAVSGTAGIIFQFPLYAGIMGIVKYSGLVAVLANGMAGLVRRLHSTSGPLFLLRL